MKYRIGDPKSYRPTSANLTAAPAGVDGLPRAVAAPPRKLNPSPSLSPSPSSASSANTVHVWTDGACSGNPGPMGIGVVVLTGDGRLELGEFLGVGTNNIAELTAIERGLEVARELIADGARPIRVYSDSAYAIGLLSKSWKAKANKELVAQIRALVASLPDLTFVKVAGHAGVPENERCDELATQAVERKGNL